MAGHVTKNLTILLTDIKGFTDKTSRKTRDDIQAMLDKHRELVLPELQKHGGNLVKTIGDAFLMTFDSPTDAVLAGVAVQETLAGFNADKAGDDRIEIRIAINSGEVNLAENDVYGEPVNITARIESMAEAGEVYFTEAVYLAMNKKEVPSSEIGQWQLKGIPEKIRVYKVRKEHPVEGLQPAAPAAKPGLLARLRGNAFPPAAPAAGAPKAAAAAELPRAPLLRRGAALAIDFVLCQILAGILVPDPPRRAEAAEDPPARAARRTETRRTKSRRIQIDDGQTQVTYGEEGIRVVEDGKTTVAVDPELLGLAGKKTPGTVSEPTEPVEPIEPIEPTEPKEPAEPKAPTEPKEERERHKGKRDGAFTLVWLLYTAAFLKLWSRTPGKRILGLDVVKMADGGPLGWEQALLRSVGSLVSAAVAGLGFLWALFEKDRRTWHDLLAGTVVVRRG